MNTTKPERLTPKEFRIWTALKLEKILEETKNICDVCKDHAKRLSTLEEHFSRQRATKPFLLGIFSTLGALVGASTIAAIRFFMTS